MKGPATLICDLRWLALGSRFADFTAPSGVFPGRLGLFWAILEATLISDFGRLALRTGFAD